MHLGKHLVSLGHKVTLAYNGNSGFLPSFGEEFGYEIIGLPSFFNRLNLDYGADPLAVQWLKSYVKNRKFDLIHGFEYYPIVHLVGRQAQKMGIPYVSDWADFFSTADSRLLFKIPFYRSFIKQKELQTRRQADAVTVISQLMRRYLLEYDWIKSEKILYLPGGAPVDQINPEDLKKCRQRLCIEEDAFYIGYMGTSLFEELMPFLKAYAGLPDQPKTRLIIMGAPAKKMNGILKEVGIAPHKVILPGFVPESEVGCWLSALNICMLPLLDKEYNYYRWPNKIGYYMAAGKPVIASSVGEVLSVFKKGDVGWLVDNSVEKIRHAFLEAVNDPERCREKGLTARQIAEIDFSWESLASEVSNFYLQVISNKEWKNAKA